MEMAYPEMRPSVIAILQESLYEEGLGVNIVPSSLSDDHTGRIVKEVNNLLKLLSVIWIRRGSVRW